MREILEAKRSREIALGRMQKSVLSSSLNFQGLVLD